MSDRDNKLPEPFDNLAVDGEVTSERYGGKESLTPGTRVVKGPGYDQGKLTAVEGNYIGTILRVDFEENAKPVLCAFTTKSEKKKEKRAVRAPSEGAEAFKTRFHIQEYREEKGINFVEVYWDNGKKEYCVIGPDTFELQLYECNFIREDDMQCDGCKEYPLHGIRWSCITCNATNLCTSCYMTDKEISNHIYKRLITKGLNGLDMPSRSQSAKNGKRKEVRGIIVGSKVDLHKENTQGTVVGFVKGNVYRYIFQDAENPDNEIDSKTIMKNYKDSKAIKIRLPERMPNDILPPLTRDMIEKLPEIRVIMQLEGKEYVAGTVVSYKEIDDDKSNLKIRIHWDAKRDLCKRKFYNVSTYSKDTKEHNTLYLFEYGFLGNDECTECSKPSTSQNNEADRKSDSRFKGLLWKCNKCKYHICSLCYIGGKHDCDGKLEWVSKNFKFTVNPSNLSEETTYLHVFEEWDRIKGSESQDNRLLCAASSNPAKDLADVEVHRCLYHYAVRLKNQDGEIFLRDISEMTLQKSQTNVTSATFYYQDHLPIIGEDELEHIVANIETEAFHQKIKVQIRKNGSSVENIETEAKHQKIQVQIWKNGNSVKKETTFRPSLHYILEDINLRHRFEELTSCPCHFVHDKILIGKKLDVENEACGVHESTTAGVIKSLIEEGIVVFKQIEKQCKEDDLLIKYFLGLAEHLMGEEMMPVIITTKPPTEKLVKEAEQLTIPVIYLRTPTSVCVSWYGVDCKTNSKGDIRDSQENKITYQVDFQQPWMIKRLESKAECLNSSDESENIFVTTEDLKDFDIQISSILTGVIFHIMKDRAVNLSPEDDLSDCLGKRIPLYINSLPVQLLKAGRWNFPGSYVTETLEKIFNQQSIQFIFEKNMEEDFKFGLFEDLRETTESTYQPPKYTEEKKLEVGKGCSILDLVFYALLKTKHLDGARQLLETGCVGIKPILIGCKILKDLSEEWKVGISEEKELHRLRRMFGRHALSIMNYIHERDERDKPDEPTSVSDKVMAFLFKKKDDVNNAGRLLLNHGYLDVAYKTENEWFLENSKLKTIIKELWNGMGYKKNRGPSARITTFTLFVLHIFLMPLLLVNLDRPPLTWFYKKYHTPILKLWINMAGVFFFLAAFAYMLLFDYSEETVSSSEFAVLFWVACKFVDELEQIIVAIKRRKTVPDTVKIYLEDFWNRLDWLIIIACTLGAILKLFDNAMMEDAAKLLYISAYVMLNVRILNMFWTSEFLGTQLVIIQKMFGNTLAFMAIVLVIMMCYNVVDYALLFPNTEFSWTGVESIVKNGYWTLYGEFDVDVGKDCTNNATIYKAGLKDRCPTSLGSTISPYLRGIYCLIAVVMLLNLLIAIYSYTAAMVHENSRMHWSQLQFNFLEEYTIRNIFPIHFKLLSAAAFVIHLVMSPFLKCVTNKKGQPAYKRVLLYDERYDVIQKDTEEAEKNGILEMQGKLEIDTDHFPEQLETLKDEMKEVKREMKNMIEELKKDMKNLLNSKETTPLSPQRSSKMESFLQRKQSSK